MYMYLIFQEPFHMIGQQMKNFSYYFLIWNSERLMVSDFD